MRNWSLGPHDPRTLTLSADFRFCQPDYLNDHTWEIDPASGDAAVFGVRTSYGLQARAMRIFHAFTVNGTRVSNPNAFFSPPRLVSFHPNFLSFRFSPFEHLEVLAEIWVPSSNTITSRVTLDNQAFNALDMQYEVVSQLQPIDGSVMAPIKMQYVQVLAGKTSSLRPVTYMTGGPLHGIGPYPCLVLDVHLPALSSRKFTWAQAALADEKSSFDLARLTAARAWDVELARVKIINEARMVEIETGSPDWDAALAFSQNNAFRLFFQGGEHLPQPAFVLARQPDQGWSARGDGRDYGSSWSGSTALEAYYMASLLPGAPGLAADLVRNHLSTQDEKGFVDFRPGLGGQRGYWLAAPILACLAWESYRAIGDKEFLAETFPALQNFLQRWLNPDRTGADRFPVWDHPLQAGLEEHPAFAGTADSKPRTDIRFLESPGLAALLWREFRSLESIAAELDRSAGLDDLRRQLQDLPAFISVCRNQENGLYNYRDRETKRSPKCRNILSAEGSGSFPSRVTFKQPERLFVVVDTSQSSRRMLQVTIQGLSADGSNLSETLTTSDLSRDSQMGTSGTQNLFTAVNQVGISGLNHPGSLVLRTMDASFVDPTSILPLWAGFASAEEADKILAYLSTNAERVIPFSAGAENEIQFPWLHFYGLGLLACGKRLEASQLVARMMDLVIKNLKQENAFFHSYQADTGSGRGERNSLPGFAPLGLFLQTLGVQILSPQQVRLEGANPFPWAVTLRYRGLIVTRHADYTDITFPDGRQVRVTDTAACMVSGN